MTIRVRDLVRWLMGRPIPDDAIPRTPMTDAEARWRREQAESALRTRDWVERTLVYRGRGIRPASRREVRE